MKMIKIYLHTKYTKEKPVLKMTCEGKRRRSLLNFTWNEKKFFPVVHIYNDCGYLVRAENFAISQARGTVAGFDTYCYEKEKQKMIRRYKTFIKYYWLKPHYL